MRERVNSQRVAEVSENGLMRMIPLLLTIVSFAPGVALTMVLCSFRGGSDRKLLQVYGKVASPSCCLATSSPPRIVATQGSHWFGYRNQLRLTHGILSLLTLLSNAIALTKYAGLMRIWYICL